MLRHRACLFHAAVLGLSVGTAAEADGWISPRAGDAAPPIPSLRAPGVGPDSPGGNLRPASAAAPLPPSAPRNREASP